MKNFIVFLYISSLITFSLFSYFFVSSQIKFIPSVFNDLIKNSVILTVAYLLLISIISFFYVMILKLINENELNIKTVWILIVISVVVLFFSYPGMLSYDIYNYMATAKVLFFYSENPYIAMPIEFAYEPLLIFMHAANKYALYGPFWIALTGVPFLLQFNFLSFLFFMKLLVILFYLFTTWLLWKMSKDVYVLVFFAFNPLILIETAVSSHNDIVMMFLALLSFLMLKRRKIIFALVFFLLSILIKFATIFLFPAFIYLLWKTWQKKEIDWKKIYYLSCLSMLSIFFLSPLREEMYPWYAIWFLIFGSFLTEKRFFQSMLIVFSISLLFRYVPFMLTGTHAGYTPLVKIIVTFLPVLIFILVRIFNFNLWKKFSLI